MLSKKLKECGVVGAGGAGFPTYIKADSKVEYMLANGAECEPLIHKDFEIMKKYPVEILTGLELMMKSTKARLGKFGVKEKNYEAVESVSKHNKNKLIEIVLLGDFYPSGDEYELVYEATKKLIPPGGIPLNVGCVVNNVETLFNVFNASRNIPVTKKLISIAGAVKEPKSFWIPIGTKFEDCIKLSGGTSIKDYAVFVSGLMMGALSASLKDVVTKTTAGLIVLPSDHILVTRKSRPESDMNRIGKSACDQCSFCTEFCPRYLLGYEVMPHKVMRSLGFTLSGSQKWNQWAELCCSCGLCTLYSCPEDLYPKEACDSAKRDMRIENLKFVQTSDVKVHPMKEFRRVPQSQLRKRLNVEQFDKETPFTEINFKPQSVKINLLQNIGKPSTPVVSIGDHVQTGDCIASVNDNEMGVFLHSSIDGRVVTINNQFIEIESK